jgi:hypothetical protein
VTRDLSAERAARNEARFREANDAIEAQATRLEIEDLIPFICECEDEDCMELIQLSSTEYLGVRADPTHFAVVAGHEEVDTSIEIQRNPRFVVIRKLGRAAELAEEFDRRGLEEEPNDG